jgi:hypothetical protein
MVMGIGTILASIPSRLWRRPTDPVSARLPDLRSRPDAPVVEADGDAEVDDGVDETVDEDDEVSAPVGIP